MKEPSNELHREFELDRMIFFSDAVFAIAITLLILDVKFPLLPEDPGTNEINNLFKPVIVHFMAFAISFYFIGTMWAKHLAIFKYLRGYNNTIISINLAFLFFIVCFPFTVSGFSENSHSHIALPIMLYIVNIACVSVTKTILCIYLFGRKLKEVVDGFEQEKKYYLLESILAASSFIITLIIMFIIYKIFPDKPTNLFYGVYPLLIFMFIIKRYLKKYKPAKVRKQR